MSTPDNSSTSRLDARIWPSDGTRLRFPERMSGVLNNPYSGVCLSGGGTRALSAGMGQLRALVDADLMKDIGYISCVSGGSWCATAFTYFIRPGSDEEMLGTPTAPDELAWPELLGSPPPLGKGATVDLAAVIERLWENGIPSDELWIRAIGEVYFEPFGLYDPDQPHYFSLNEATAKQIAQANPSLEGSHWFLPRSVFSTKVAPRPYLVINSSLVWPPSLFGENLLGFEYTPLSIGMPFAKTLDHDGETRQVGGGLLEPFAYGCPAPSTPPTPPNGLGGSWRVQVAPPSQPFTLVDASGTSSSAFAASFDRIDDDYSPQMPYWPVSTKCDVPAKTYDFADGGSLENFGLIALLLRQVRNLVVFVNTSVKLSTERTFSANNPPAKSDMSDVIPQLFGVPVRDEFGFETNPYPHDQVFDASAFGPVSDALQAAKKSGGGVVAVTTLETMNNDWWGVTGGIDVQVCWVYLDRVAEWESKLITTPDPDTGKTILEEIEWGNRDLFDRGGPLEYFPNYLTVDEESDRLVQLSNYQVNLLGDLSCWVVQNNLDTIRGVLTT